MIFSGLRRFPGSYWEIPTCRIDCRGPPPLGAACWMCAAKELASSSSSLQALVFIFKPSCLQLFASISVFNFLLGFWLSWKSFFPLHILPIGLIQPPRQSPLSLASAFFCVFLSSMFFPFFRLFFLLFLMILSSNRDPKIKPRLVKVCFG